MRMSNHQYKPDKACSHPWCVIRGWRMSSQTIRRQGDWLWSISSLCCYPHHSIPSHLSWSNMSRILYTYPHISCGTVATFSFKTPSTNYLTNDKIIPLGARGGVLGWYITSPLQGHGQSTRQRPTWYISSPFRIFPASFPTVSPGQEMAGTFTVFQVMWPEYPHQEHHGNI